MTLSDVRDKLIDEVYGEIVVIYYILTFIHHEGRNVT